MKVMVQNLCSWPGFDITIDSMVSTTLGCSSNTRYIIFYLRDISVFCYGQLQSLVAWLASTHTIITMIIIVERLKISAKFNYTDS